ncbi:MAG TPA: hypothetical protein VEZ90_08705 [Blastocatellia bacterium]|nr:hypothetical protein [Blastocatellia bacterium]
MSDRFFPKKGIQNARVTRPVSPKVFVWLAMAAILGSLICASFVVSAKQHFTAVSAGYDREQLRQQATLLDQQLKRLELQRAQVTSPVEVEKRAEKAGMHRPNVQPSNIRRPASESRGEQ